ncbi:hypothetical protein [Flavilitoribacter nigricans]|uniref:hypothetical protein n=1 Tax=Flavilitoribacter nigricans TaxID=70997 RepID=UPI001179C456|nr:hypothetical protein [Flavilitoribacter nigricans]
MSLNLPAQQQQVFLTILYSLEKRATPSDVADTNIAFEETSELFCCSSLELVLSLLPTGVNAAALTTQ